MKKEDIYVNLRGESDTVLTDLWEFLINVGETPHRTLDMFLLYADLHDEYAILAYSVSTGKWCNSDNYGKQEVTIQQLKEILQPMVKITPIAMRCTQEQFEAIKPKLDKLKTLNVFMFNKNWNSFYLALFEDGRITNGLICSSGSKIKVHEEWDEELFLKACGLETSNMTSKDKITKGDWVITKSGEIFKMKNWSLYSEDSLSKIIDQYLIKKLNELNK